MDSASGWEILGLVKFAQPYQRTGRGEQIIARFSVRSGALVVSGALLIEGANKRRSIWFSSARNPRVHVETEAARRDLVRLCALYMAESLGHSGLKPPFATAPTIAGDAGSGASHADHS